MKMLAIVTEEGETQIVNIDQIIRIAPSNPARGVGSPAIVVMTDGVLRVDQTVQQLVQALSTPVQPQPTSAPTPAQEG